MPRITVIEASGVPREIELEAGDSALQLAHDHDVDLECACDGSLACATCHVIIAPRWYGKLPEPSEEEIDMLDLALNRRPTSRLGCQLRFTEAEDGLVLAVPDAPKAAIKGMA